MKYLFSNKLRRINPFAVVCIIALLTVGVVVMANRRASDGFQPEVIYADSSRTGAREEKKKASLYYNMMDDPNYRTSDRVRDASSLALVLGIYRVGEFAQKRPAPPNVETMLAGLVRENLLPPGLSLSPQAAGVVLSKDSTIYVRYRVKPFGVEVVSIPQSKKVGDNVLVRLPSDEVIPNNAPSLASSLYTMSYRVEVQVPEPFSSRALVEAQGWKFEPLRESKLSPEQVTQMAQQLKAMSQGGQ